MSPVPLDEFPIHQVPLSMQYVGSSDRNFYDRAYLNAHDRTGDVFLITGLGVYPNLGVIDAYAVVRRGDRQWAVRCSDGLGDDRLDQRVGPYRVEVLEPLQRLRLVCDADDHGIGFDLTWHGSFPAVEEQPHRVRHGAHTILDACRFAQLGTWSGVLRVGGDELTVDADRWLGTRDRSWGIRPVGEPAGGTPVPIQFFWLWSPINFDDLCTHFDVNEDGEGTRWHEAGMIVPLGGAVEHARSVDYRLEYRSGTRHARQATVTLRRASGDALEIDLRPLYEFAMVGLGYQHPRWGHGMYLGDADVGGESWALADVDPALPMYLHVQAVCEATLGTRRGIGILEQLIIGPHRPSGFTELLDLAP